MQEKIYNNRKNIFIVAIIIAVLGALMGYKMYGVEPWETVAGAICGFGFSIAVFTFSIKPPENNILDK